MKRQHTKHIFSTLVTVNGQPCYDVENTANGERFRSCDAQEVARYIRANSKSEGHLPLGTMVHDAIHKVGEMVGKKPADCLPCAEREALLNRLVPR